MSRHDCRGSIFLALPPWARRRSIQMKLELRTATSLRCASHWLRADHMLTVASSPLLSLSLSASQPLAPQSLNCSQSPPSLSSTLTALFRNNMPDEATTSLRTNLPGPCLCNDQPLMVYVAASPLLSLSLSAFRFLALSLSTAVVSRWLSGSACFALLV